MRPIKTVVEKNIPRVMARLVQQTQKQYFKQEMLQFALVPKLNFINKKTWNFIFLQKLHFILFHTFVNIVKTLRVLNNRSLKNHIQEFLFRSL